MSRHERLCDCAVCLVQNRHRFTSRKPAGPPKPKPTFPKPKPPRNAVPPGPRPGWSEPKPPRKPGSGRKCMVPAPMVAAIEAALAEGMKMAKVARKSGATYEMVRTIKRRLDSGRLMANR